MKTFSPTPKDIKHDWYVVDAQDQVLGRLASQIAHRLRGKHKPEFAPHVDNGDFIIVINCEKIKVTGTKMINKLYRRHSGWVGGLKETPYRILMQEQPELAMKVAVRGMLPKNTIGKESLKRLHIYADANYEQQAQKPVALDAE